MKLRNIFLGSIFTLILFVSCDRNDDSNSERDALATEYISYQVDSGETIFAYDIDWAGPIPILGGGLGTELWVVGRTATGQNIQVTGDISTPGVYTTDTYHYGISGPFGGIYAGWGDTPVNTMSFNLINHGNIGEYIDLTFSGTYTNDTGVHTLNGVVHVVRSR
ncbi:hypothetical protein FCR2A7T_20770 [Flavobacterium cauense R2A-7]|uniref:Lipoprotein n=1 Tax=Flavobacterium cauense R2A-7 TaxID=1341154 RepID=V6S2T5_9FLAO|nr:hypothetical protein [Flavobacterium cauense]ESU18675.1 hypothetical protein FCR2A7T_20770 [Flavobacterium cauense R2A-7]KGO81847.1 hypothetical protein Q762_08380 [Flavobacterium cauense R2A-7]TWI13881.1 hypothetical protein IP98_01034 [Flavobacterium cauense R2A-7]